MVFLEATWQDHGVFESWNTLSNRLPGTSIRRSVREYENSGTPFRSSVHVTHGSCVMRPTGTRTALSGAAG